jgi:formate dehydrogenase (NADP+) beta subunit
MALFKKKEKVEKKGGIEFQERDYKPSKYHIMTDPEVATAPMGIKLDEDKCIGCGICIQQCPSQILEIVKREKPSAVQAPACESTCPADIPVREYMKLVADGASFEKAWAVLTKMNPFPAVTGRVCPHPCETACNRTCLDKPVNINCIERTVGDYGIEKGLKFDKPAKGNNVKVAVVGSGPSGLSCAYQLALMGYAVTVFEASSKPGGMLSYAIPSYRLPEEVVGKEILRIMDLGVSLKVNTALGKDITLDGLKKEFKAVYLAIGAQGSTPLGIAGDDVLTGLAFLRDVREGKKPNLGKNIVVVGGGNTAIDTARTAKRMGADVTVLYRRTMAEMPAYAEEVDAALEEGVNIQFLCAPVKLAGGKVTCQKMELGEPDASGRPRPMPVKGSEFDVKFNTLIAAIGQDLARTGIDGIVLKDGWIGADEFGQTSDKNVFAGGDAVSGPGMVSEAIGAGRTAALGIDAFIRGVKLEAPYKLEISFRNVPFMERLRHLYPYKKISRTDAEEGIPYTADQTVNESKRCIECGTYKVEYTHLYKQPYYGKVCLACHNCEPICPQGAIAMQNFYRVDEGRWATELDIPVHVEDGLPNPLRLTRPLPFKEIEPQLTETEKVIYKRRSVRIFKTNPVPRDIIERVLEAGRFAPTAGNCCAFKFIVITDRGIMDELSDATANFLGTFTKIYNNKTPGWMLLKRILCMIYPNATDPRPMAAVTGVMGPQFGDETMHTFFDAPVAIMVVPHELHISQPELGMGIVCQNMVLAAHSLGLGTCYVGLTTNTINKDLKTKLKFKKRLGLKWPYDKPAMFLLLGYPAVQTDGAVPRDFPKVEWIEPK